MMVFMVRLNSPPFFKLYIPKTILYFLHVCFVVCLKLMMKFSLLVFIIFCSSEYTYLIWLLTIWKENLSQIYLEHKTFPGKTNTVFSCIGLSSSLFDVSISGHWHSSTDG